MSDAPTPSRGKRRPIWLLGAGAIAGLYAMAPAAVGRLSHLRRGVEVVDHVIPGLVVIALVGVATGGGAGSVGFMVVAGTVVCLAGLWMTATHVGLLEQAIHHQIGWNTAVYHCSTAALVVVLGVAWVWRYREALAEP